MDIGSTKSVAAGGCGTNHDPWKLDCVYPPPPFSWEQPTLPGLENLEPHDTVNHPPHYKDRVPGIEAIEVTEHFNFNLGNVIKYVWRSGTKGGPDTEIEDLRKAAWYLQREIERLTGAKA